MSNPYYYMRRCRLCGTPFEGFGWERPRCPACRPALGRNYRDYVQFGVSPGVASVTPFTQTLEVMSIDGDALAHTYEQFSEMVEVPTNRGIGPLAKGHLG